MGLLDEIIARALEPHDPASFPTGVNDEYQTQPGAIPGSWLDEFTKKKKKKYADMPSPVGELPAWGDAAGLLAPGIGGLGNLAPATVGAPVGPTDPNYADPSPKAFDRVPNAAPASVPMPRPGPQREADGTVSEVPATALPAIEVSSARRGPAAAEEGAGGPVAAGAPNVAPNGPGVAPGSPQMAQPGLWDNVGSFGGKIMQGLRDNSSTLLALGAGFAGAPNIGQGISRAAQYAIPAVKQDLAMRTTLGSQSATYKALIEAGVPANQALAAIGNPELQKRLFDSYIKDHKYEIKSIKDSLGNESLVAIDPQDPTKTVPIGAAAGVGGGAGASGTAAAAQLPPVYDPETHRDEAFLGALDPETASAVKAIADGKTPATGRNMQKYMPLVTRYENGFDNTTFQARQKLQSSYFGGGEGAKQLRSANTVIDHGIQLKKAIEDLHNFSILPQYLNKATGAVQKQFDPKYQAALKRFKANSEVFSKELDFALTGKSTVSGAQHIRDMFDSNASTPENMASLTKALEMLDERIHEHENTYNTGMNKHGGGASGSMLSKRKELDQLLAGESADSGKPSAVAAPAPGRYAWDPATGKMKLLK